MQTEVKSILDNVIYLNIETTGLDEKTSEIIEIGAVKIKDSIVTTFNTFIKPKGRIPLSIYDLCIDLREEDLLSARNIEYVKSELLGFLEVLPLICSNGEYVKSFFEYHIIEVKNEVLDLMEMAAILEPWRKEYNLQALLNDVTTLNKNQMHRGLQDSLDTILVVNSFLCRLWTKEEVLGALEPIYKTIIKGNSLLKKWNWTNYLLKPIMFNNDEYIYVYYKDNKEENIHLKRMDIDYNEYEDLLKKSEIWDNGGDFSYEYREEQKNISSKIRQTIENKERIFIEAPTGSGKTFAYVLIVAISTYLNKLERNIEESSVIISTDTKELQNQLIEKDIPNILKKLSLYKKINFGAIKGKSNYLCTERVSDYKEFEGDINGPLVELFIKRLIIGGKYGDIENIGFWAYKHFELDKYIKHICCESENCNLDKCIRECYLKNRYNELPLDNITVINHSLLANWPYGEKKKIYHLIIDEAHNLMEKAYDFFSEEFNSKEFLDLLDEIENGNPSIYFILRRLNANFGYRESVEISDIKIRRDDIEYNILNMINEFRNMNLQNKEYNFTTEFFNSREEYKLSMESVREHLSNLKVSIYSLYKLLDTYISNIVSDEDPHGDKDYRKLLNYIMKLKGQFDVIDTFITQSNEYAKILEVHKEFNYFKITNTPLKVGELVNDKILSDVKSTTFLSATLRIDNSFNNIKKHLGQESANEYKIPAVFNLKEQTRIFTLKDLGSYNSMNYIKNISGFIFETAKKLNGHMLVLFNNNSRREQTLEELSILTKGTTIELHTNKKALKYLRDKNRQIIMLGTKGFFEGIDLPGDALTCVIIDKLPNQNVENPLVKAITTYEHKKYYEVNYPQLCIKVKQSYGRLIRSTLDYGYFIILDGGTNNITLRKLEKDLSGPRIENVKSEELLSYMDNDYKIWKMNNLRTLLNNLRVKSKDIPSSIKNEAVLNNLFWEFKRYGEWSTQWYFKNINTTIKVNDSVKGVERKYTKGGQGH
ncbi:helicase C-terminal domain-containing protein [Clostridium gasigenes]|uniref:DNA 5'-3' helicase n=1 Tax=Clostridium gasigenes TaxID=94869 RepID=A0A1H0NAT0_9CLOT|nr:helicase C-terminal domain-containing protein [Clostridium gasigenes]SDO89854.1 ATP-dependent DNA helicase DinG [Clostridium gasigenes]